MFETLECRLAANWKPLLGPAGDCRQLPRRGNLASLGCPNTEQQIQVRVVNWFVVLGIVGAWPASCTLCDLAPNNSEFGVPMVGPMIWLQERSVVSNLSQFDC